MPATRLWACLCRYMHTGALLLPPRLSRRLELLRVAAELGMLALYMQTCDDIQQQLCAEDALRVLAFSEAFGFSDLEKSCRAFLQTGKRGSVPIRFQQSLGAADPQNAFLRDAIFASLHDVNAALDAAAPQQGSGSAGSPRSPSTAAALEGSFAPAAAGSYSSLPGTLQLHPPGHHEGQPQQGGSIGVDDPDVMLRPPLQETSIGHLRLDGVGDGGHGTGSESLLALAAEEDLSAAGSGLLDEWIPAALEDLHAHHGGEGGSGALHEHPGGWQSQERERHNARKPKSGGIYGLLLQHEHEHEPIGMSSANGTGAVGRVAGRSMVVAPNKHSLSTASSSSVSGGGGGGGGGGEGGFGVRPTSTGKMPGRVMGATSGGRGGGRDKGRGGGPEGEVRKGRGHFGEGDTIAGSGGSGSGDSATGREAPTPRTKRATSILASARPAGDPAPADDQWEGEYGTGLVSSSDWDGSFDSAPSGGRSRAQGWHGKEAGAGTGPQEFVKRMSLIPQPEKTPQEKK